MRFVDTNILLYSLDLEPLKPEKTEKTACSVRACPTPQ